MTQTTQRRPQRRRQIVKPDEISLPVVHLGASLKPESHDLDELWTYSPSPSPEFSKKCQRNDKNRKTPVPKSPRHKNMLELSQAYKTSLPLSKGYWKIPGLSTNIIGYHSKDTLSDTSGVENGAYERKFRMWYNNCFHGNHGLLPPIGTMTKANGNIGDSTNILEKNSILMQVHDSSPHSRISGSDIYSPRIYSNSPQCKKSRRMYTRETFTDNCSLRNNKFPECSESPDIGVHMGSHHGDVLSEIYFNQLK